MLKIAMQVGLIPGQTIRDKQLWAADHGVEGIEVSHGNYSFDRFDQARKDFEASPVPLVSFCGNPSFDFLDPDPKKRRASIEQCRQTLVFCGSMGMVGQIVPPIFGGPRIPDLSPLKSAVELEKELLTAVCRELGAAAAEAGTLLLLEPLNRYEEHLLRRQAAGVEIIERCGQAAVALISDFFHMHIEETSTPNALRAAGRHVRHLHLADNTRMEPGTGDIDFTAGFRALKDIGFDGFMAYECGVSGPDRAASLVKSLDYVRDCIARA
ncbi:MAG: sugar phosphate isomerase/epimerase [Lentisphaeria bacterium]|nr:sugar phosphate isomerase/epimerase [Lentisphaeria bacterium]